MWGAGARTGLMRWYQRKVVRVVTSSLAIRMSPGQQRESGDKRPLLWFRAASPLSSLCGITITRVTGQGHCRAAHRLQMTSQTSHNESLCSVSGYVTHNWASQDPGHYGDITMPWHSYTGHPETFYLSWITCSCETCAPLYPVPTIAPWDAGAALNSCQGGLVWGDPAQSRTDKEKMMHGQDQDQGRGAVKTSRARCHIPSHSHRRPDQIWGSQGRTTQICFVMRVTAFVCWGNWPVTSASVCCFQDSTPRTNIWREAEDIYLKSDIKPLKSVLFHLNVQFTKKRR